MVEIIVSVVIEVAKCLAPSIERQFSYVRDYTRNFKNLNNQVEKLEGEIVSMENAVNDAERKGEEIEQNVQNWLARANKATVEGKKFVGVEATANKHSFKGCCPNFKMRRRLSKEAVRQLDAIVKLREDGRFERISHSIIPEDTLLMSNKGYEDFESRMSTLNDILGALRNPDISMLGICGMGGIGKTMLAKEVARKAKNDKLFDLVVFSEVSQSPDIRKIQGEIADKLGLTFREESESGRARRLFSRLKKEKRILVILDNIWEYLDLQVVGIPHGDGDKGCKVLLTARSLEVLSRKMDSQQNFVVRALAEEEAWSLFKMMAGDYVEGSELKCVTRDVAKECAGFPVSIVTVARALRDASIFESKDALRQLRRPSSTNFKDIQPAAYKAIVLSYNKLEGEEVKNLFLLIGYAYVESIDELLRYGVGLGLYQGISKMEEARDRISTLVYKLKASCMLLDEGLSMHDVVRDVAISIASAEKNVFTATGELFDGCKEWSDESAVKLYTSIVLRDIKTNVLPNGVQQEYPQLKLFSVRADHQESSSLTIPNNFFERMIQVRVVNLTYMNLLPLPSSLGLLSKLRTLSLCNCNLLGLSVVGDLKKLEILCLRGCGFSHLPVEVGQLTWLKLLDLRGCDELEVMPPNILSNLSHLEELYIGTSFYKWEVEVGGVKNASLLELKHLHNLTSLDLHIKDVNSLPRGLFFEKLERYRIPIGYFWNRKYDIYSRNFRIELNTKVCLKDVLIVQLQGIEHLGLEGLQEQDVQNFVNELVKLLGSSQLKHLYICGSHLALNPEESEV
ncbi:Disease resistance protein [Citrus sinensis]|uniref:disease resistance protein At4g27190-like n=1 Tax=Citrus sinensis TaxID=2711 RepID=UPI00219099C4|nr:disease resistance protein At4g27190-like [Citrus sinensis]KAH9688163.1 Disease resistance protein [Citrus sinensis]